MKQRTRAAVLLCLSVALGGLALAEVRGEVARTQAQVGPGVPVVVAGQDLRVGARLGRDADALVVRDVPESFVPADSFAAVEELRGARLEAPAPAGAYITAAHLERASPAAGGGSPSRPGERVVQIPVAAGGEWAPLAPRTRVDLVVTTESRSGGAGRSYVALESVEVVGVSRSADQGEAGAQQELASLRVSAKQAVFLVAAANFAREVRLLPRASSDRGRVGPATVASDEL